MKRLLMIGVMGCIAGAGYVAPPIPRFSPVDLQPYANQKLADNLGSGTQGNNLTELSVGEYVFRGVKLKVGEGFIQLGSKILETAPEKVEGIQVNRTLAKLHILQATCWSAADGTLIGEYRVTFEDRSTFLVPIVYGRDVRDWLYVEGEQEPSHGKVVWKGDNEFARQVKSRIRLYLTTWENPWPDKKVTTIDYLSKKDQTEAAPFCVAISAERK
jgi:hypothetical protein